MIVFIDEIPRVFPAILTLYERIFAIKLQENI